MQNIRVVLLFLTLILLVVSACTGKERFPADGGTSDMMPEADLKTTFSPALKPAPAVQEDTSADEVAKESPTLYVPVAAGAVELQDMPVTVFADEAVSTVDPTAENTDGTPASSESVMTEQDTEPTESAPISTAVSSEGAPDPTIPAPISVPVASPTGQQTLTPTPPTSRESGDPPVLSTATRQPTAQPTSTSTSSGGETSAGFTDCAFRTGGNATIALTVDMAINGGLVLEPGDEIAVFTPDGLVCAGGQTWKGQNVVLTAWGNDSQTEVVDGLSDGEVMLFRIWDASEHVVYNVKDIDFSMGDGVYTTDSIHVINAMTVRQP